MMDCTFSNPVTKLCDVCGCYVTIDGHKDGVCWLCRMRDGKAVEAECGQTAVGKFWVVGKQEGGKDAKDGDESEK